MIIDAVTLREAGRRLEADPKYVKGAAEAFGIKLGLAGTSLVMSEHDFVRLRKHLSTKTRKFRISSAC